MTRSSARMGALAALCIALTGFLANPVDADIISWSGAQSIDQNVQDPNGDPNGRDLGWSDHPVNPYAPDELVGHGDWIIPGDDEPTDKLFPPLPDGSGSHRSFDGFIAHGDWIIPGDDDDTKDAIMPGDPGQHIVPFGFDFLPLFDVIVVPKDLDGGKSLWDIGTGNNGSFADPLGGSGFEFHGDDSGAGDVPMTPIPAPQTLWPIAAAAALMTGRRRRR